MCPGQNNPTQARKWGVMPELSGEGESRPLLYCLTRQLDPKDMGGTQQANRLLWVAQAH